MPRKVAKSKKSAASSNTNNARKTKANANKIGAEEDWQNGSGDDALNNSNISSSQQQPAAVQQEDRKGVKKNPPPRGAETPAVTSRVSTRRSVRSASSSVIVLDSPEKDNNNIIGGSSSVGGETIPVGGGGRKEEAVATSSEEEDGGNLVVIGVPVTTRASSVSPGSAASSSLRSKEGSDEEQQEDGAVQSYCIIVNPDGSLELDAGGGSGGGGGGGREREDVPGKEKFNVTLPLNKIKCPTNPLPGAVPIALAAPLAATSSAPTTSRPSTSGRGAAAAAASSVSATKVQEEVVAGAGEMSGGVNVVGGVSAAVSMDFDELAKHLDPQSLADLDNLIQSQHQLIENLDLSGGEGASAGVGEVKGQQGGNDNESVISSSTATASMPVGGGKGGGKGARGRSGGSSISTSTTRISEGDSSGTRRSQRQQDRIERQEAERILAENQQMLQREKEIMQSQQQGLQQPSSVKPPSPIKKSEPSTSPVVAAVSVAKPALVVARTTTRDSIDSNGSDRKPYPKRENRRLPAHLADPNILSLEVEAGKEEAPVEDDHDPTALKIDEDEDYDPGSADDMADDYAEDDPNTLWCICRQPHNNRFMICCDTCEDWFHGKCVGVTKAQGKVMEMNNVLWKCPRCKKAETEKQRKMKASERSSHISRRSSGATSHSSEREQSSSSGKLNKASAAQQAEAAAAAVASKTLGTFVPSKKGSLKRVDSYSGQKCVCCGKSARKDSIYCSDECVHKHAESVGKSTSKTSENSAESPNSSSPNKLKRTNSKPETKGEPIFNFHVIPPGSGKSTEVVPPILKSKEVTASQILRAQKEGQSPTKPGRTSPGSTSSPSSSASSATKKNEEKSSGKDTKSNKDEREKASRARTSSQSDNKPRTPASSSNRKSEGSSKLPDKPSGDSEKLHRDNMRKGIRELLKTRMKENMTEKEQEKINEGSNNPDLLGEKIADELCRTYGGASTIKCKNKYRSIYFNLKDAKNLLYQELLLGSLKPKVLVKMESHEMASAELAEWRKKESDKEIEAIKKAELDKITESKKIQLLEKGVADAVTVAEAMRPQDISEVIDSHAADKHKHSPTSKEKDKSRHHSSTEKSKHHSTHSSSKSRDKGKESSRSHHRDKDKDRKHESDKDKEKRKSHRSRHSHSSSHRSKDSSEKVKHTISSSKSTDKESSGKSKSSESPSQVSSGSGSGEEQGKSPVVEDVLEQKDAGVGLVEDAAVVPEATPPPLSSSSVVEKGSSNADNRGSRHSVESEQEQPSSTIKTPDFAEEGLKKDSDPKHLFQTKVVMHELGSFNAAVHTVSHASVEGIYFPKSPVPVVGRITPETVWDYISKMKKSKEVIVLRLSPASQEETEGYMQFYSYFSSRGRFGVMGPVEAPLKDVYLVPLSKQSPVPRCLLPFRGPGLPEERTHCLLCIVTRNIKDPNAGASLKRKSVSSNEPTGSRKKAKVEADVPPHPVPSASKSAAKPPKVDDDDAPYIPWEDEEDDSNNSDAQPPVLVPEAPTAAKDADVHKQLLELEERIQREQQDIEKITGALAGRSNMSGIPGLDGEFGEESPRVPTALTATKLENPPKSSSSSPEVEVIPVLQQKATTEAAGSSVELSDPRLRKRNGNNSSASLPAFSPFPSQAAGPSPVIGLADVDMRQSMRQPVVPVKEPVPDKVDDPAEKEEEEAYSPSAVHFSDEESSSSSDKKESGAEAQAASATQKVPDEPAGTSAAPAVTTIDEDSEPLPPGVEPEETAPTVSSVSGVAITPTVPTAASDIKINFNLPKRFDKNTPQPSQPPMEVDLEDGFKPPHSLGKKQDTDTSVSAVFEKVNVPSPSKPIGSNFFGSGVSTPGQKMKININLLTKQLPTTPEEGKSKTGEAEAGEQPKSVNEQGPTQVPPPPPMQFPPPQGYLPPPPSVSGGGPPMVINFNVPPPPMPFMMQRPPPSVGGIQPPPFSMSVPPPSVAAVIPRHFPPATSVGGFTPFGSSPSQLAGEGPGTAGAGFKDERGPRGQEPERVHRLSLEPRETRDDRPSHGRVRDNRDARGGQRNSRDRRGFRDRRSRFDRSRSRSRSRSPVERIKRRRSKSRSRSRSRSPRDRRHKRRTSRSRSRSRSKSPLSRRWEATSKARNRSRSRSGGRRDRNRSRSHSPRRRASRSPKRRSASPKDSPAGVPSPLLSRPGGINPSREDTWEVESDGVPQPGEKPSAEGLP